MKMPPRMRAFEDAVSAKLQRFPDLDKLYRNCFESTVTTAMSELDGTTYVLTGDIPAMWLRDSSAQATPYLPVAADDPETARLLKNMLERQFFYIGIDPYANAFNARADGSGHKDDTGFTSDWLWERKYEIDSLCYPFWFADKLYKVTGDDTVFADGYVKAARLAVETMTVEQHHGRDSRYRFIRTGEYAADTLDNDGRGADAKYTGMTWSGFRPSDDRCRYPYFIPGNLFAVTTLELIANAFARLGLNDDAHRARALGAVIDEGVHAYGVVRHEQFGEIYACETDGEGNYLLMDDANVPSLLSLPYLGYCAADDPKYLATRRFVLSGANPYFFRGKAAEGIGSPHTPEGYVWHISIILRALTSADEAEIAQCLKTLTATHAGTYVMHEGFHKDDPAQFTRPWFAWANSLLAVLVQNNVDRIDRLLG